MPFLPSNQQRQKTEGHIYKWTKNRKRYYLKSSLYPRQGNGVSWCLCLSVRLSASISLEFPTHPIFTKFFVHFARSRGSVLLWQRSDMLCISSFIHDVAPDWVQCVRSLGLGYERCTVIPVAGQRTHGPTCRVLKVTPGGSTGERSIVMSVSVCGLWLRCWNKCLLITEVNSQRVWPRHWKSLYQRPQSVLLNRTSKQVTLYNSQISIRCSRKLTPITTLNFYRADALPDAQLCQSTEGITLEHK